MTIQQLSEAGATAKAVVRCTLRLQARLFMPCIAAMLAATAIVASPRAAMSARPKPKAASVVAVFPLAFVGPRHEIIQAADALLERAGTLVPEVHVIAGDNLRKALKAAPAAAVAACKQDFKCVAKLGRKVGAAEVLVGEARVEGAGISVSFSVVASEGGTVARKLRLDLATVSSVNTALGGSLRALLGAPPAAPGSGPATAATTAAAPAQSAAATPAAAPAPAPATATNATAPPASAPAANTAAGSASSSASGHTVVAAAPAPAASADASGKEKPAPKSTGKPAAAAASTQPTGEASMAEDLPLEAIVPVPIAEAPPPVPGWSPLRWSGLGVAAAGAVPLAVGAYFGIRAIATEASVGPSTSQIATDDAQQSLDRQRRNANISFAVGGCLVAAGAVLLGLDLWVVAAPAPQGTAGEVQAALGGRF